MKLRFSYIFFFLLLFSTSSIRAEICHIDNEFNHAQGSVGILGIDVNDLVIFFDKKGLPSKSTIYVHGNRVNCQLIPTETNKPSLMGNYPEMEISIVVLFDNKQKYKYNFYLSSPTQVRCRIDSNLNCNQQQE
ncbi:hypothetical protein [Legionella sainthelensi]|uniref:hypothetical protein n=1 Tax=Legionella sainthelensi TaxID=28087 RepID=UPI000E201F59|nr:hypothetical protein [Legionella sainthelensi]